MNLNHWRRSVISLAFHIVHLNESSNLITGMAADRHEFFFSDFGVPRPRPCTAMAWASLCAIGPIQGYVKFLGEDVIQHFPFDPTRGRFLLPFLPKVLLNEESNQTLSRQSKAHEKDSANRIRWGSIYIGDSHTGQIIEQLPHGQRLAKDWIDSASQKNCVIPVWESQHRIPPLYASVGEGWQFGLVQNIPSINLTLRDPMVELARSGIPETYFGGNECPRVRRLMIRFLDITAAREWAKAYAKAMESISDSKAIHEDIELLVQQIKDKEKKDSETASSPKGKKKGGIPDNFLAEFMKTVNMSSDSSKTP